MSDTMQFIVERGDGLVVLNRRIKRPPELPAVGQQFTSGASPTSGEPLQLECLEVSEELLRARIVKMPPVVEKTGHQTIDEATKGTIPLVARSVRVDSFSPQKEPGGPLTEVHLSLEVQLDLTDPGTRFLFVSRMRTREAVQTIIDALIEHRDHVFPT